MKAKTHTIILPDSGTAEAVGFALMSAIRRERDRAAKYPDDAHAADLVDRLEMAYACLDGAIVAAENPTPKLP